MLTCDGSVTTLCACAFVKTMPARGEAVEERRLHARVAGEADGVRAQRVDRDEDDVGLAVPAARDGSR